jgi:sugar phosphate isomerase/epimerase
MSRLVRVEKIPGSIPGGGPKVATGRGDVAWEAAFRTLNAIGYAGPLSVE